MIFRDCIVLCGSELEPWLCERFETNGEKIVALKKVRPCSAISEGSVVIMPGLWNSHTHMGDSCAPDGATGLTLEQGFFRPNGYKYRMLAEKTDEDLLAALVDSLTYMGRTGTIAHIDYREQSVQGAQLLRAAASKTGITSLILGQFDGVPFDEKQLKENKNPLPPEFRQELIKLLEVADGFSESTMNDLTDPGWIEVRELTASLGKYRSIHCLEDASYRDTSVRNTGRGDLIRALDLYEPDLVIHVTVANDDEIRLLADRHITCVLNPRANASLGLPLPPIAKLLTAGVNLLLGTDNGLLNSPNMLAELDYTYRICKAQYGDSVRPSPEKILAMASVNIQKAFSGRYASALKEGGDASFVTLDFSAPHLRRSQHIVASVVSRVTPADVICTYKAGRPLYSRDSGV